MSHLLFCEPIFSHLNAMIQRAIWNSRIWSSTLSERPGRILRQKKVKEVWSAVRKKGRKPYCLTCPMPCGNFTLPLNMAIENCFNYPLNMVDFYIELLLIRGYINQSIDKKHCGKRHRVIHRATLIFGPLLSWLSRSPVPSRIPKRFSHCGQSDKLHV